jgi:hypothetical protein
MTQRQVPGEIVDFDDHSMATLVALDVEQPPSSAARRRDFVEGLGKRRLGRRWHSHRCKRRSIHGHDPQMRLCGRFRSLTRKGKQPNVIAAAIARELSAFIWAICQNPAPSRTNPLI